MSHRSRTSILAALAAVLMLPSISAAQDLAPVSAPAGAPALVVSPTMMTAPTVTPNAVTLHTAAGPLASTRPVGLQRYVADSATAPMTDMKKSRSSSVTLMVFGLATLLVGTVVDGDTGTVIVLTGAGIGLVGLYRYLNQ
jgi:hypothetical protein